MTMKRYLCAALWCALLATANVRGAGFPGEVWVRQPDRDLDLRPAPRAIAADSTNLYVATKTSVLVVDQQGTTLHQFGSAGAGDGQFDSPFGLDVDEDCIYLCDYGNNRIQVFSKSGTFLRKWGTEGTASAQFKNPRSCAVAAGRLYVVDANNHRIQVFTTDGDYVRMWGGYGNLPGQFAYPGEVKVANGRVYVHDWQNRRIQVSSPGGAYLYDFDLDQARDGEGWSKNGHMLATDGAYLYTGGRGGRKLVVFDLAGREVFRWQDASSLKAYSAVIQGPFLYVAEIHTGTGEPVPILCYRRVFRTPGSPSLWNKPVPRANVLSTTQRQGQGILDIDYTVVDANAATVAVHAVAFEGSTHDLDSLVPIRAFVDGTEANVGTNITPGVTNRISWNVSSDWSEDYGDLRVAVLVKDDVRQLLDLHYLELPALNGNPAVTINRVAISQDDFRPAWIWWVAENNAAIRFDDGAVYGVGGNTNLFANSAGTTDDGRAFVFEQLGIREATPTELQYAREATTPGAVTRWPSRFKIDNRPTHVNEFCFDTGTTNGWWVVKE